MEFRVLGPLEVVEDGRPVAVRRQLSRALLAYLLLHANQPVSADRLVDELWGPAAPRTATASLQNYVSTLRKLLGAGRIELEPAGYVLHVDPEQFDLARFDRLVSEARTAPPKERSQLLRSALALWRGPPLEDLAFEEFAQDEIRRLDELRLAALEERIEAELALGRHEEVLSELDSLVRANPLRERLQGQRILSLYRCGRQAEALAAYRAARRRLVEELGLEPSPELQRLERAILAHDPSIAAPARYQVGAGDFPPLKSLNQSNLPEQPTPFLGRKKELTEVRQLLRDRDVRLLTLTGPGGSGKTRLALQLAAELLDEFPDGVWFVNLAAVSYSELVLPTVAQTLGVREQAGRPLVQTLAEQLQPKRALLLVDNFEQVSEAAPAVAELLAATQTLKVVVTSRVALHLSAEREYLTPALAEQEAVALFVERAKAVKHTFVLDANRRLVEEICRRLDQLPLAIELAAARIKVLSEQALLERLDQRLKLLTGGPRDVNERQQTLRATIDWSYELLTTQERTLFRRLAVFAGGGTLKAIEAICNSGRGLDTFEGISSLIDKSLLRREEGPQGEPRFVMLETVQEYARGKLHATGEADTLRERHARYFAALLRDSRTALRGTDERRAFARLAIELDNLRAFADWSLRHDPALLIDVSDSLASVYIARGQLNEARRILTAAVAAADDAAAGARTEALLALASVAASDWYSLDAAEAAAIEALELASKDEARHDQHTRALRQLAQLAYLRGEYADARARGERALASARNSGDEHELVTALTTLVPVLREIEPDAAGPLCDEAIRLARRLGDKRAEADAISNRALIAGAMGDHQSARNLQEKAREIFGELGDEFEVMIATGNLGLTALYDRDSSAARPLLHESLRTFMAWDAPMGIINSLEGLAGVAVLDGDGVRAAQLYGSAAALRDRLHVPLSTEEQAYNEPFLTQARTQIGNDAFERSFADGRALSLEAAVREALELDPAIVPNT